MPANAVFFDKIRPLFGGKLTELQVDGMNRIIEYSDKWGYSTPVLAYILATVFHETAKWMQPIREGARRYGPTYSDAAAKRAVAAIHAKGFIRRNYALPDGPHGQSYYGRGLVQITWYDNYLKFEKLLGIPLTSAPDLALEWEYALDILFLGMKDGMFTDKKLKDYKFPEQFEDARDIVNGDRARHGAEIARIARAFLSALEASQAAAPAEPAQTTKIQPAPAQPPENRVPEAATAEAPARETEPATGTPENRELSGTSRQPAVPNNAFERGVAWVWPF